MRHTHQGDAEEDERRDEENERRRTRATWQQLNLFPRVSSRDAAAAAAAAAVAIKREWAGAIYARRDYPTR